jgi:plastocyanin
MGRFRFLAGVAVLAAAPALTAAAPPAGRALSVTIEDMRFQPATLDVRPGDRVTWTNNDLMPHTVTAGDGRFDSRDVPAGAAFTWVAVGAAGPVAYACRYHPSMAATLTLAAPGGRR